MRRSSAVVAGAATLLLVTATCVIALRDGSSWGLWQVSVLGTAACVASAVLLGTPSTRRTGRVLLLTGGACAVSQAAGAYEVGPGAAFAQWVSAWQWPLFVVPLLTLVPLRYPDDRLPGPRWAVAEWTAWTAVALLAAGTAASEAALGAAAPRALADVSGPVQLAGGTAWAAAVAAGAAALVVRWRRGDETVRAPVLLLGAAVAVGIAVYLVEPLVPPAAFQLGAVLWPTGVVVAVTVGALRRGGTRDPVLSRSTVVAALAALGLVAYGAVVALLAFVAAPLLGAAASAMGAGVVLLGLEPARRRARRLLVRTVRGDRDEPLRALADLRRRLAGAEDHEQVLSAVPRAVVDALRLPHAALLVFHDARLEVVAEAGAPAPHVHDVPLVHRGERIGVLRVAQRSPGRRLDDADLDLLAQIAHDAAATASAVRLDEQLRTARRQLVTAVQDERERLRRDLHDGLGPLLAGAGLALEGVRLQLEAGRAPGAPGHLAAIGASVRDAAGEVRRVVQGLGPEALDERGLAQAVAEHLVAVQASGVATRLDLRTGPLPLVLEHAAYRIVLEAVTNALRHAAPSLVEVRLVQQAGTLRVEVEDDGPGMPASYISGVGIDSMRRRAGEVGGTLDLHPAQPHGTVVTGCLPVRG